MDTIIILVYKNDMNSTEPTEFWSNQTRQAIQCLQTFLEQGHRHSHVTIIQTASLDEFAGDVGMTQNGWDYYSIKAAPQDVIDRWEAFFERTDRLCRTTNEDNNENS